jgi:hypothetical protein
MTLKEHQARILKLPYKTHALRTANGKRLITANPVTKPSALPKIILALEDMDPGDYVIRCSNGSKDGYDYPISTVAKQTNAPAPNVSFSQAPTEDLKTAERLGRLEAENDYLKTQLAEANDRIRALEAEETLEEGEDLDLDDLPPSPKEQLLEAIAPVIPALADRALAVIDKFLNKPAPGLAEAPKPVPIDYDRLAEMVKDKLIEAQQYETEENG